MLPIALLGAAVFLGVRSQKKNEVIAEDNEVHLANSVPGSVEVSERWDPTKEDNIGPKSWTYDLTRIGDVFRYNTNKTVGPYPEEKKISSEAAGSIYAPIHSDKYRESYVGQQLAYVNDSQLLDPLFWDRGVQPNKRIVSKGRFEYTKINPSSTHIVENKIP